jgi:hypothetical protein
MDQNFIALLSLLATIVALLLTAIGLRRGQRGGLQTLLLNDLAVLKALKPGSHHFERANEAAARRAHQLCFSLQKPDNRRLSWLGAALAALSVAATVLEGRELTYWTPIHLAGFFFGFEAWRRSLFPNFASNPPPLELVDAERTNTDRDPYSLRYLRHRVRSSRE